MADTRILVVDDESITLDFFDIMLSKLGFEVIRACDGEEALEKVKEYNPDIIMTDNILPKLTGWQFTRVLKTTEEFKDYREIPVIMLSAVSDVKDKIEGYDLGVEDYILKPFNFLEVLARIRAVLRNRELARQVTEKEKKIAAMKSANKSMIYFTNHLKTPLDALLSDAGKLDVENPKNVSAFLANLTIEMNNMKTALATLDSTGGKGSFFDDESLSPEAVLEKLEIKFQEHIAKLSRKELER